MTPQPNTGGEDVSHGLEAYHDELGVREGKDGDLFVVTEDTKTLLTRDEALELAGMLIRHADDGFVEDHRNGRLKFADMLLDLHIYPEGLDGERVQLDRYEFLDDGAWNWWSNDSEAILEFVFGKREGFTDE